MSETTEAAVIEIEGRAKRSFSRKFILSAGVILLITGVAKVWSGLGTAKVLAVADPITGITFGRLMLIIEKGPE